MKKQIGVSIIGCGVIAPTHIESYLIDSDVKIISLCDIVEERAKALAAKYNIPKITTNPQEVFDDENVDAVSICTPHYNHAELALGAIDAGKDVICEKPISNTFAGIDSLCKAEVSNPERILSGVFQHRYNPIFKLCRELVQNGAFGTIVTASMHHRGLRTKEYYEQDSWRGTKNLERGGVLINQAIHYLDLFQWILGGVKEVLSYKDNLTHKGIIETEDTIVSAVKLNNGALGTIEATNSAKQGWNTELHITGTDGYVSLVGGVATRGEFCDPSVMPAFERARKTLDQNIAGHIGAGHYGYGHPVQIADFLHSIRTREAPFVTFLDAAKAARLTLDLYDAAK